MLSKNRIKIKTKVISEAGIRKVKICHDIELATGVRARAIKEKRRWTKYPALAARALTPTSSPKAS